MGCIRNRQLLKFPKIKIETKTTKKTRRLKKIERSRKQISNKIKRLRSNRFKKLRRLLGNKHRRQLLKQRSRKKRNRKKVNYQNDFWHAETPLSNKPVHVPNSRNKDLFEPYKTIKKLKARVRNAAVNKNNKCRESQSQKENKKEFIKEKTSARETKKQWIKIPTKGSNSNAKNEQELIEMFKHEVEPSVEPMRRTFSYCHYNNSTRKCFTLGDYIIKK